MVTVTTMRVPAEQRFRLSGVSWPTYLIYSDGLGPRHVRVTDDQGEMELMTVSPRHERGKALLARLIGVLTEELGIDIIGCGSMTCRQEDFERGFEPDDCYWIAHVEAVRGHDDIDFAHDPPPDLAIEVEISRSTMNRLRLYASLGVPELWRWDGERLRVNLLGDDGEYHESDRSQAFPFLPVAELALFLTMRDVTDTEVVRAFRKWVRQQHAAGWGRQKGRRKST